MPRTGLKVAASSLRANDELIAAAVPKTFLGKKYMPAFPEALDDNVVCQVAVVIEVLIA